MSTAGARFSGSICAIVTPMQLDGSVAFQSLAELVEWHVSEGTDAIVAVGTTGESATLDVDEHLAVIKAITNQVRGRIPVIAGTGANATSEAMALTRAAAELKVDAALVVTPYYNKPPQEGLFQHYRAVAGTNSLPIILYNVPGRTGCDMLPSTVERLLIVPNVVGLKEARGDEERRAALLSLTRPAGFSLLTGDDATARVAILEGYDGDISVTANVAPKAMHLMCAAARAGNAPLAAELDAPLASLHEHLFCEPNPIPVKWALQEMGRIPGGMRLPLVPLSTVAEATVRDAMSRANLL